MRADLVCSGGEGMCGCLLWSGASSCGGDETCVCVCVCMYACVCVCVDGEMCVGECDGSMEAKCVSEEEVG